MVEWQQQRPESQDSLNSEVWSANIGPFKLVLIGKQVDVDSKSWVAVGYPGTNQCVRLASHKADEAKCQAIAHLQCVCADTIDEIVNE